MLQWVRTHNTCPICRHAIEQDPAPRAPPLISMLHGWREATNPDGPSAGGGGGDGGPALPGGRLAGGVAAPSASAAEAMAAAMQGLQGHMHVFNAVSGGGLDHTAAAPADSADGAAAGSSSSP